VPWPLQPHTIHCRPRIKRCLQ